MPEPTGRRDVTQDVFRSSLARTLVANVAGFGIVAVYTSVVSPYPSSSTEADVVFGVLVLVYIAGALFVGLRFANRVFTPTRRFVRERRPPSPEERRATLGAPNNIATFVLGVWLFATLLGALPIGMSGHAYGRLVQGAAVGALGGVATALLTYFLVERAFRPLYALVLSTGTPSVQLGIRPRLLASWALGSAIPLVALLLATANADADADQLRTLIWYCGAVGLAAGFVLIVIAARSVANPVRSMRRGLRRVQSGRLDATVVVDDGGEMGLMQVGFNSMVEGLRERQMLQDLFGRHVGAEVARAALEGPIELGGSAQDVSVLFVDLIGSTELAQQLAAPEVVAVLNDFFGVVVAVTHAEGGWVNKFEGDAALCVFGAPGHLDDHAACALRAARSMRDSINGLRRTHRGIDAGIGVSSGTVVAGNVGAMDRFEYTVIGDPVNEAARVTEVAKQHPCRVLASSAAIDAAPLECTNWVPADSVTLRGRAEPTRMFAPRYG